MSRARHLLVGTLATWGLPHLADSAALVVSELVTNSVRHAKLPRGRLIQTRFERVGAGVRIEVHDAAEASPELRQAAPDAEAGRGLALVDVITSGQWGVSERGGVGKLVWAVCADDAGAAEGLADA